MMASWFLWMVKKGATSWICLLLTFQNEELQNNELQPKEKYWR